jgi:hypothetical protein
MSLFFALLLAFAPAGRAAVNEDAEVAPAPITPPAGVNDGDARTPDRNPRRDELLAECFRGVKARKNPDSRGARVLKSPKTERPEPLAVAYGPGAEEALRAANARRMSDAAIDRRVKETFDDRRLTAEMLTLSFDEEARLIRGVWTPRHQTPPYFKVYEIPLNNAGDIEFVEVRATDEAGVVMVEGYGPGYEAPYRLVVAPYCWRDASPPSTRPR